MIVGHFTESESSKQDIYLPFRECPSQLQVQTSPLRHNEESAVGLFLLLVVTAFYAGPRGTT